MISSCSLPITNKTISDRDACFLGKSHKFPFSRSENIPSNSLDIIYIDIWAPSPKISIDGFKYYINFVDVNSRFNWLYPLVNKLDALTTFIRFHTMIEKQLGKCIKAIQTDNGGDILAFKKYVEDNGILHRFSCPRTHEQMGMVERRHMHIVDTTISFFNIVIYQMNSGLMPFACLHTYLIEIPHLF